MSIPPLACDLTSSGLFSFVLRDVRNFKHTRKNNCQRLSSTSMAVHPGGTVLACRSEWALHICRNNGGRRNGKEEKKRRLSPSEKLFNKNRLRKRERKFKRTIESGPNKKRKPGTVGRRVTEQNGTKRERTIDTVAEKEITTAATI